MKVHVVVVGSVRGPLSGAVAEYEERARRYWKIEVTEVQAGAPGKGSSAERIRTEEEDRLLARIHPASEVWALTRAGRSLSSRQLARDLEELAVRSTQEVSFVIGGAFGLGERVLGRARRRMSVSSLTFPHEMARLVLAEQLYRAGTILRNEPYHKGA